MTGALGFRLGRTKRGESRVMDGTLGKPQPAPRSTHPLIILSFTFTVGAMVGRFMKRSQGHWQNYLPAPGQDSLLSFFSIFSLFP